MKVSTTIFTSQDIVHYLLFLSKGVIKEMGILRAFENQESIKSSHPIQLNMSQDTAEYESTNSTGKADSGITLEGTGQHNSPDIHNRGKK